MNISKFLLFIMCLGTFSVFQSCKDEATTTEPGPQTKTDFICLSAWKLTGAKISPDILVSGSYTNDFFPLIRACEKDDLKTYKRDSTGTFNQGGDKCNINIPTNYDFQWSFDLRETKLTEGNSTYNLVSLDANKMELSFLAEGSKIGLQAGIVYNITAIYTH